MVGSPPRQPVTPAWIFMKAAPTLAATVFIQPALFSALLMMVRM